MANDWKTHGSSILFGDALFKQAIQSESQALIGQRRTRGITKGRDYANETDVSSYGNPLSAQVSKSIIYLNEMAHIRDERRCQILIIHMELRGVVSEMLEWC